MATCKDCICYSGCSGILNDFGMRLNPAREVCDRFEDRSRFVELPCKVGDTIYWNLLGKPVEDEIVSITIYKNVIRVFLKEGISFDIEDIGRMLFLSREEAEQALKACENSD